MTNEKTKQASRNLSAYLRFLPPKKRDSIYCLASTLCAEHESLAFNGMLHFRNKLIQQGRYTDAVDELLIKLQKVRRCRHG